MKIIKTSLMAMAILLVSVGIGRAQTADEVIQKYITAVGGADAWKKVKSVRMIGAVNYNGTELPVTVTFLTKKAMRAEYSMNGMTGYDIVTDKEGWTFNPFMGQKEAQAKTAEEVKENQDQLDQMPLLDYKTKGHKVVYIGKDDIAGNACYKLQLTLATGKEETLYFDAKSYYQVRAVSKTKANGKDVESVANYSNYQKLPEGISVPMTVESEMGPFAIKTVEINKNVDESIFKPSKG
jgi:hypothetical protein